MQFYDCRDSSDSQQWQTAVTDSSDRQQWQTAVTDSSDWQQWQTAVTDSSDRPTHNATLFLVYVWKTVTVFLATCQYIPTKYTKLFLIFLYSQIANV
jgi:Tfp pilus assembly protein FimT